MHKEMRRLIVIVSLLHLGIISYGQHAYESEFKSFNEFLGSEKAAVFDSVLISFDRFLAMNYPNEDSDHDRYKKFLMQFAEHNRL